MATEDFPTIAEAEALLPQARKVADAQGISHDKAPLLLGYVSLEPPPPEAVEYGRKLIREGKWPRGGRDGE